MEAHFFSGISKVPLFLILSQDVWSIVQSIFPGNCCRFFMFQMWRGRSPVSRAPFSTWRGRDRPTRVHLWLNSGFSGWREGKAGACGPGRVWPEDAACGLWPLPCSLSDGMPLYLLVCTPLYRPPPPTPVFVPLLLDSQGAGLGKTLD